MRLWRLCSSEKLLCFQCTFPFRLTALGLIRAPQSVAPPSFIEIVEQLFAQLRLHRSNNSLSSEPKLLLKFL